MSGKRGWAAALAGCMVLTACSLGPSRQPDLVTLGGAGGPGTATTSIPSARPTGPGGPGRTSAPIDWSDCPAYVDRTDTTSGQTFELDCGQVSVPVSYTASRPEHISVAVTRARRQNVPITAPVLFTVLDEPAAQGTQHAAAVAGSLPAEITNHYSVVVMDLRGTSGSANVDCVSTQTADDLLSLAPDPTTSTGADLIAQLTRTLTFNCGDEAGPDLSSFAVIPASDDIDNIRAALGVDQISYLGRGFGATLGAEYVDRYPGRVAAMVLDGPADPLQAADKRALAVAAAQEKALDAFAAACVGFTGGCPLGPDPRGRIVTMVGRLGETGVTGNHQIVNGGSVLLTLMLLLAAPDTWPALAKALAAADQTGDVDALADLLDTAVGGSDLQAQLAGSIIYGCNDSATRLTGPALTAAATAAKTGSPVFGAFAVGLVGLCGGWPVPDQPLGAVTGSGAPPLLVLGAVDDPRAPLAAVQSLAGQLQSAELVRWQSVRHGTYPASTCVTGLVDAYLLHRTVPAQDTLCPP